MMWHISVQYLIDHPGVVDDFYFLLPETCFFFSSLVVDKLRMTQLQLCHQQPIHVCGSNNLKGLV
jgi:hypothetical protein